MAPASRAKATDSKKTTSNAKAPTPAFTPSRQLNRMPPPEAGPRIAGTPIAPESSQQKPTVTNNANNSPTQQCEEKTATQKAQDALNTVLSCLQESYQPAAKKVNDGANPDTMTVEMPYRIFEQIGGKVVEALNHLAKHAAHPENILERLSRLEQAVKESTKHTTRTWAQVTAAPPQEVNPIREIQQRNQERQIQERRERAKFEVTLTTQQADLYTREQLVEQSHADITARFQEVVNSQLKDNTPIIDGVQKLRSRDIRIHCNTSEEAEQLRKLKWEQAYNGLAVRQSKYGVIIDGVPANLVNPKDIKNPKVIEYLEQQNKGSQLEIAEAKLLKRKLKDDAQHFSLIAFFTKSSMADHCIKHGVYVNHERLPTRKYTPQFQVVQCYKCQKFGHHATVCRSPHSVCAKCSEHHPTSQCHSETYKCACCNGGHPA